VGATESVSGRRWRDGMEYGIVADMVSEAKQPVKRDIQAVIILLATQCLIYLGEIPDPIHNRKRVQLSGAKLYLDLLEVLRSKTRGNLTPVEDDFLAGILANVKAVYKKHSGN